MAKIYGNTVGATGGLPKSFLLETEDGTQLVGVTVGEETVFTATDNDVRENLVYAGDKGLSIGKKFIPSYYTIEGSRVVTSGSKFEITKLSNSDIYDYTKLQAIICEFNTDMNNSTAAVKVSINDSVYETQSTVSISTVTKNIIDKSIDLGIANDTDKPKILRYFMYKEEY